MGFMARTLQGLTKMELAELLFLKPKPLQTMTPKRTERIHRQNQFLTLLFKGHITFTEAARQVGISRNQAYHWFAKWKQQEGYEIDREWWQLYNRLLDESPEKAFEGLTRLKYRMTPQRIEEDITSTHTERIFKVELSSRVLSNETCNNSQLSPMNHTINKPNSTKDATPIVTEQHSQA